MNTDPRPGMERRTSGAWSAPARRLTIADQSQALLLAGQRRGVARHLIELLEDAMLLSLADARAGVPDLQQQPFAAAAAADEHAAVLRAALDISPSASCTSSRTEIFHIAANVSGLAEFCSIRLDKRYTQFLSNKLYDVGLADTRRPY